jgi:cytochrome P450
MYRLPAMTDANLPPGPPLPAAAQTLLFFKRFFAFVDSCRRRYGDVFTLRIATEGRIVYLADPEAIAELFRHDGVEGHAGAVNSVLEPVTGPQSILLLDREHHLRERRLLSPAFHGEAIQKLETIAREAAERELSGWTDGATIAARPAMQRVTFEIIARAVLGADDPRLRERLLAAFEPVFDLSPLVFIPALRLDLGPRSPWGGFRRAMDRLDRILYELIRERRAQPPRADVLGALLAATDEHGDALPDSHVRDELVTLLLAGHETTATSLAWALERLARHPDAVVDARAALSRGEEEPIEAIAAETLRVRPVVMDVARRLSAPLEVAGYPLAEGTTVMPSIYLVQMDRRSFAEPEAFAPRRFLEQPPSRSTWLPFGGGRRRCLGAALAQMELRVVLSEVLARWTPEPVSSRPERPVLRGLTFVPEHGGRMRMRRFAPVELDS